MPFNTTNMPDIVRHNMGWVDNNERDPAQFIPYFDHIRDDIIVLKNGALMGMIKLEGEPFNLKDNAGRNGHAGRHFALYQMIADPQIEITEHLVCHKNVVPFRSNHIGTPYMHEFMERYDTRVLNAARQFDWFITIIVHPRPFTGEWFRRIKKRGMEILNLDNGIPEIEDALIRRLNSKMRAVMAAFKNQRPQRLGVYVRDGYDFSEMGRALHLIRTARMAEIPRSQPAGTLGAVLYRDRVVHGSLGFLLHRAGGLNGATVGRVFGLSTYPRRPRVGMFDPLLSDKEEIKNATWVLTNHIRPLSRAKAATNLELTLNRLRNADTYSYTDQEDLEYALDALTTSHEIRGAHAFSFVVHAPDMETLDEDCAHLTDTLANAGSLAIGPVGVASEVGYWSQWPGNRTLCPQPARSIGLRGFTALSSLEGHWTGLARQDATPPRWGVPLMRFLNAGGGVYDHELFDGRIGHTLFCGPSDGGKSVTVGSLLTVASKMINNYRTGQKGTCLTFDKDESQRLTIVNNGGNYTTLKRGEESGAAPLLRLHNTPENQLIIFDLILGMILSDGGEMPPERVKDQIRTGIAFEMRKPADKRTIAAIHAWLPPSKIDPTDSANRLKPWCRGERLGWAFDGTIDNLNFNVNLCGVDCTALLKDDVVMPIMAAYLFHLAGEIMDSRRVILIVEELKAYLPRPEFTRNFEDVLLTGRKKNLVFWPIIQQPEHLLLHPLGPALLGQCRTRFLFKNEYAERDAYVGREDGPYGSGLNCTPQIYAQVKEGMTVGGWSVIIQRPGKSVLCRFDLSSMPEDLAVLSGNSGTNKLWDRIAEQRKEFLNRLHEAEA